MAQTILTTKKKKTAYRICKAYYKWLVKNWAFKNGEQIPTFEEYCKSKREAEIRAAEKVLRFWKEFDYIEEIKRDEECKKQFVKKKDTATKKRVVVVKKTESITEDEVEQPQREKGKVYIIKKKKVSSDE
jgi:hypothetical protein